MSDGFIDPSQEAVAIGAIASALMNRVPDHLFVPAEAFTDERWNIIYAAYTSLRRDGAKKISFHDINHRIDEHGLASTLQRALGEGLNWTRWPEHADIPLQVSAGTEQIECALRILGEKFRRRKGTLIGRDLEYGNLDVVEAIQQLQQLAPNANQGELFIDLEKIIDGGLQPERPTIAQTPTGTSKCLLYAGRLNEIHGEPAVGKTNVALSLARCVIEEGGHVVYLDPEDTPVGILSRLSAMGADVHSLIEFFHYVHNPTPADFSRAIAYVQKHKPALVILDGLAEALAAEGKDENAVADVLTFFRERLRPFAEAGAAVLIADHVTKSTETRGKWARGSGAKLGRYDGVSYAAEIIEPYSPTLAGKIRLRVSKDRNGGVGATGEIAMELHFTPRGDGVTIVDFQEPLEGQPFKPTALMAKIVSHLELFPDASKNDLRRLGKHEWVDKAIAELVSEGTLKVTREGQRTRFSLQNTVPLSRGAQYQKDSRYQKDTTPLGV